MEKGYFACLIIAISLTSALTYNPYGPICPIQLGTILTGNCVSI